MPESEIFNVKNYLNLSEFFSFHNIILVDHLSLLIYNIRNTILTFDGPFESQMKKKFYRFLSKNQLPVEPCPQKSNTEDTLPGLYRDQYK